MMTGPPNDVTQEPERAGDRIRSILLAVTVALTVFAIGMGGGGYELPASGEIVVLGAWILLFGAIAGLVPAVRPHRSGVVAAAALLALIAWSLVSIGWADSAGRSVTVAVQYGALLAVLLVGLLSFRDGDRPAVLGGLLGGVALVALFGVWSRFDPSIAPEPSNLVDSARVKPRLHWPIGYWNALGFLAAMVIPLALHFAADARRAVLRGLAAATIPLLALCVLFTLSRGAIAIAALGVIVGLLFGPLSVRRLGVVALSLGACAVLITEAVGRRALMDGLTDSGLGATQASEIELLLIVTAVVLAAACAAAGWLPERLTAPRGGARIEVRAAVGLAGLLALIACLLVAGQGPRIERAWNDFRSTSLKVEAGKGNSLERLGAQGSSGRWQLWESAVEEGNSKPTTGTGAGTFEAWWTERTATYFTVRNAHSQYLEVYGELGAVGVVLMLLLLAGLVWGCVAAMRRAGRGSGLGESSAASATVACFVASSAFDWGWQVTVIPMVAMLAFAANASELSKTEAEEADEAGSARRRTIVARVATGVAALALIALALPPVVATSAITKSQEDFNSGDLSGALSQAKTAVEWQPYSAAAWLQRGLVEDATGASAQARKSVKGAIDREPNGWRNWLALAGVEARAGNARASLRAYRRARDLNPNSPLFAIYG